ncbi:MAG: hypothetical protein HYX87_00245 [Chloroflexi bacterium]|nr:hypothetical protein [Chloroflexota bacterium]
MAYKLKKELSEGKLVRLSLGIPEVDAYLEFFQYRSHPNTRMSYGYDLQVFFNTVAKPVGEVTSWTSYPSSKANVRRPGHRGKMRMTPALDRGLTNRTVRQGRVHARWGPVRLPSAIG